MLYCYKIDVSEVIDVVNKVYESRTRARFIAYLATSGSKRETTK